MRKFPNRLQTIVGKSGLNLNNISQASGVSNPYLAKLMRGGLNRPGKDKITSILLALNYTITEINAVLADYDYLPLQEQDIPDILKNNRARKIVGGNLPQYDHIYFDLLLVVLEQIGGTKLLVKNRPSGVFMPHELYLLKEYPYEANDAAARFRYDLTAALLKERSTLFLKNCRAGTRSVTYICRECLTDYGYRHLDASRPGYSDEKARLVSRYFANALSLSLKFPERHQILIMERCPYFHFQMQDADGEHPKVSYPGRKLHVYNNEYDKRLLEGFTTDLPHIVAYFRQEIEMCHGAVLTGLQEDMANALQTFFEEMFARYNLGSQFREDLVELLATSELKFH